MLIGLMSDSHDNLVYVDKALNLMRTKGIEILIHLGDIVSPFTLRKIAELPVKTIVILGNNDGDKILLKEIALKAGILLKDQVHEITIDGLSFLLLHGFGTKEQTLKIVRALAQSQQYDVIAYGHTHEVHFERIGRTTIVNPGEVCGYLTGKASIAFFDTKEKRVEIVNII